MKRPGSIFGVGLTLVFVMFSAGPVASAAFPAVPGAPTEVPTAAQNAKRHYLQGEAYFKSRNFSDAMDEYQRGYLEKPDPVFIFNMAQCQRLLGHRAAAVEYYQRYLREAPDGPGRSVAENQIADLQAPPREETPAPSAYAAAPPALPAEAVPAPSAPAVPPPTVAAPEVPAPPPVVEVPTAMPDSAPPAAAASITSAPAPSSSAPVYVTASAEPPPLPVYKRPWFWAAAGAVFMGALLVAAEASSGKPGCDPGRVCK